MLGQGLGGPCVWTMGKLGIVVEKEVLEEGSGQKAQKRILWDRTVGVS